MEKNKQGSSFVQEPLLYLADYQLLLNSGSNLSEAYLSSRKNTIALKQLNDRLGPDGSRVIAAPIAAYEHSSLHTRLDDVFIHCLLPFIHQQKLNKPFLHIHCPERNMPQASMINPDYIRLALSEWLPGCSLFFSSGSYLAGLKEAEATRPNEMEGWFSVALDAMTDDLTLKQLNQEGCCMTSLNDKQPAPGEAYIMLKLGGRSLANAELTLLPPKDSLIDSGKHLRAFLLGKKASLNYLIHPNPYTPSAIQLLLSMERELWPLQDMSAQRAPKWLSPYRLFGDVGAASEALCLLLAFADAMANPAHQGLMLANNHAAAFVQILEPA